MHEARLILRLPLPHVGVVSLLGWTDNPEVKAHRDPGDRDGSGDGDPTIASLASDLHPDVMGPWHRCDTLKTSVLGNSDPNDYGTSSHKCEF